jgi:uncharacterized Zn finger protein
MNCEKCLNQKECESDCTNCFHKEGCGYIEEEKPGDHYFHVGEKVELKGRIFRVKNVKPSELRLKLIPGCVMRKNK